MGESEIFLYVYDELRQLARQRLSKLPPGNTLQPTALVHEVYLRLQGDERWNGPGHFFGAAAEAMRQILVDQARKKYALKAGGDRKRSEFDPDQLEGLLTVDPEMVLTIHDSLTRLEREDPSLAEIVKLRYFSGLSMDEISSIMEIPVRTLQRRWRFASAYLRRELDKDGSAESDNRVEYE